jgi:hypothetical protein
MQSPPQRDGRGDPGRNFSRVFQVAFPLASQRRDAGAMPMECGAQAHNRFLMATAGGSPGKFGMERFS